MGLDAVKRSHEDESSKQNIYISSNNVPTYHGYLKGMGESFIAVKKYWKISQVVMVITSEILNLSRVAKPRVINSIFHE